MSKSLCLAGAGDDKQRSGRCRAPAARCAGVRCRRRAGTDSAGSGIAGHLRRGGRAGLLGNRALRLAVYRPKLADIREEARAAAVDEDAAAETIVDAAHSEDAPRKPVEAAIVLALPENERRRNRCHIGEHNADAPGEAANTRPIAAAAPAASATASNGPSTHREGGLRDDPQETATASDAHRLPRPRPRSICATTAPACR
jgi:hypothetical protein